MTGGVPPGWAVVPLGEVAEVQLGKMLSEKARRGRGARPYLRNVNVRWHAIDTSDVLEMDFEPREVEKYQLKRGDVLVCEGGEPGRAAVWDEQMPGTLYQKALHRVRFHDGALHPRLFTYQLELAAANGSLAQAFTGSTIKHLPREAFIALRIVVPPLAEQRRIVAALEEHLSDLDAAEEGLERARRNAHRYEAAVLEAAIRSGGERWDVSTVAEIAEVVTGTTPPTADVQNYGGDLPFFKPTDLNAGYELRQAREHLSAEGARCAHPLPAGSVLVTCIGATIGKTGLARVECATNQQINAAVVDRTRISPEWLFWWFRSPRGQSAIKNNASATTLPILNKSKFSSLVLPLPPLPEQQTLVADVEHRISVVRHAAAEIEAQRARAVRLRGAILKRAFEGNLVPQNPNDEPAKALLDRIRNTPTTTTPRPRGRSGQTRPAASRRSS